MITIIRYRNKETPFFGLEGEVKHPRRIHSGYTDEEIENSIRYDEKIREYRKLLEKASPLNTTKTISALDNKIPDWKEEAKRQLDQIRDLTSKITFNTFEDMRYQFDYTLYHLKDSSLGDLAEK